MNLKKNILLIVLIFFSNIYFSYIYNDKNFSFIDPDDNLHLLLKSETALNCIDQNCKGLNFFASELNKKKNNLKKKKFLASLKTNSENYFFLSSLTKFLFKFLNKFTKDYSLNFKLFLITNILLLNFSLFYFCRDYIPPKYLYFFFNICFFSIKYNNEGIIHVCSQHIVRFFFARY